MKKITMLAISLLVTCASFAQVSVTEMWNFSTQKGNLIEKNDVKNGFDYYDGELFLASRRSADTEVVIYDATTGQPKKNADVIVQLPKSADISMEWAGGDVAVDNNGSIYCVTSGNATIVKWENKTATPVAFANFPAKGVWGMDVYIDVNGNGCLVGAPQNTSTIYYIPITNNKSGLVKTLTVAKPLGIVPRAHIVDAKTFWIDGNLILPTLITLNDDLSIKSQDPVVDGGKLNPGANGISQFSYKGKEYIVAAANNHGAFGDVPKHSAALFQIDLADLKLTMIGDYMPKVGLGGTTDATHFVKPVVDVTNAGVMIYLMGGMDGIAAYKFIESVAPVAPSFSYAIASVEKTFGDVAFTNELTNNSEGVVTYTSSIPTVATVDAVGLVHVLSAGTTTITAKVSATSVHLAATASYELTVNPIVPIQVKKIWEKSTVAGSKYAWCTGSNQRDMSYYNGTLYVQDKKDKLIRKIKATDGTEDGTIANNPSGVSVTVADDGTVLYSLSFASTSKLGVAKWTDKSEVIMDGAEKIEGEPGRIDFFSAYGSIENGYLAAASTNTSDAICVWSIKKGVVAKPLQPALFKGKRGQFSSSADVYPVSVNSFWVSESAAAPKFFTMNEARTDVTVQSFGETAPAAGASGIAQFTYKRKTYAVCAESVNGAIGIYDITAGIDKAVLVTKTESLGTDSDGSVKHCPIAVNPVADGVEIFVYATNNGIASYKFTDTSAIDLIDPTFAYTATTVTKTVKDEIFANPLNTNTNGKITYDSSDKTVATVDVFGNITVLKAGATTVSATAAASEGYKAATASCELTVALVTPTVAFANATETKTYGDKAFTNELTNEAKVTVAYRSSDKTVATVDAAGLVTILKAGTTTIKAVTTATDIYKSVEASYGLTVKLATPTFKYEVVTMSQKVGDAKFTNALTSTTDATVTYASSDPTVATIAENGEVTILKMGETVITASAVASDKYAAATATYQLTVEKGTGIDANKLEVVIANTADGIMVQFEGEASIEVYTINGTLLDKQVAVDEYSIALNQGIYIIRVNGVSYKVVK